MNEPVKIEFQPLPDILQLLYANKYNKFTWKVHSKFRKGERLFPKAVILIHLRISNNIICAYIYK